MRPREIPPPAPADIITVQLSPPLTAFRLDAEDQSIVDEVALLAVRYDDTTLEARFLTVPVEGVCEVEWVPAIQLVQGEGAALRVTALRQREHRRREAQERCLVEQQRQCDRAARELWK